MDYLQYIEHLSLLLFKLVLVLNLVINGLPSILLRRTKCYYIIKVLNLVINGLPSIQNIGNVAKLSGEMF